MTTGANVHATPRRTELFDQVTTLFLAEGFAHLTLEAIASRLRCSKSTLYTLANSKDDLVRAAVVHFFIGATADVEAAVAREHDTRSRIFTYLDAVGAALAPATASFMEDVAAFAPAREIYERNTGLAADRIRGLLLEGSARSDSGLSDSEPRVHVDFVADVVASSMVRIQSGEIRARTGLDDSTAYRELARMVTTATEGGDRR